MHYINIKDQINQSINHQWIQESAKLSVLGMSLCTHNNKLQRTINILIKSQIYTKRQQQILSSKLRLQRHYCPPTHPPHHDFGQWLGISLSPPAEDHQASYIIDYSIIHTNKCLYLCTSQNSINHHSYIIYFYILHASHFVQFNSQHKSASVSQSIRIEHAHY